MKVNEQFDPMVFNADWLQEADTEYVCWLDVMGSKARMERSLSIVSNFIYKLHSAVQWTIRNMTDPDAVGSYPMMDGVFLTCKHQVPLLYAIGKSMSLLAETFLKESQNQHRFVVRGAIACGQVYHGKYLHRNASEMMWQCKPVRNTILIGQPMLQAHSAESQAPPFGIAVADSARSFAPGNQQPLPFYWYMWYNKAEIDIGALHREILNYLDWHKARATFAGYCADRIERHRALANEFFIISEPPPTVVVAP